MNQRQYGWCFRGLVIVLSKWIWGQSWCVDLLQALIPEPVPIFGRVLLWVKICLELGGCLQQEKVCPQMSVRERSIIVQHRW